MRYVKASKHSDSGSMMPIRIVPHCDIDSQIMLVKVSAEHKLPYRLPDSNKTILPDKLSNYSMNQTAPLVSQNHAKSQIAEVPTWASQSLVSNHHCSADPH
jgi:hypothetical protein